MEEAVLDHVLGHRAVLGQTVRPILLAVDVFIFSVEEADAAIFVDGLAPSVPLVLCLGLLLEGRELGTHSLCSVGALLGLWSFFRLFGHAEI